MNLSILVSSFRYLQNCDLTVSLATWIYQELTIIKYTDDILIKLFNDEQFELVENIIHLNRDIEVLNKLLIISLDYESEDNEDTEIYKRLKILLEHGANVHIYKNYLLFASVLCGYLQTTKLLITYGADVRSENDHALRCSSTNNNIEIVKLLLNAGADVHANNDESLRNAFVNKHIDIIKLLVQTGANVHVNDDELFNYTNKFTHNDIIYLLTK